MSVPSVSERAGIVLLSEDGGFHYVRGLDEVMRANELSESGIELPFPEPGTIEGRVTVAGEPLADTRVYLQWKLADNEGNTWDRPFGAGGQLTTDADGKFKYPRLGPGRYRISRVFNVDLGRGRSTTMYLAGDDVVLLPGQALIHNVERPAGVHISGTTFDADGEPLGECVVTLTIPGDNSERIEATMSDTNGHFTLSHLAPGSYDVIAEHYPTESARYYNHDFRGTTTVEAVESIDDVDINTVAINRNVPQPTPKLAGTLAADFSVTPYDASKAFTLSDNYGKVVAISFWGTWFNDVVAVNDAYKKFRDNPDVEFITIFLQDEESLREHLKKTKVEFPVVTIEADDNNPLSAIFGVQGQPGCLVIGRDGRFASERIVGSQLVSSVARALAEQVDESLSPSEAAQLSITISADGSDRGVPAAELALKVVDGTGRSLHEGKYSLPGLARRITWRYPVLGGQGRVIVTLRGRGIDEQEKILANPSASEQLKVNIDSPQQVTGRIANVDDDEPIPGIEIKLQNATAGTVSSISDSDGRFSLPCFPGFYYVRAISNDDYAAVSASGSNVTVENSGTPKPLELKVARAVTIRGRVLGESGEPVAGAIVMTG